MCAMFMCDIRVMVVLVVPLVGGASNCLFPWMHVWALTFCIVILYGNHVMRCIMKAMRSLSGWLCWEDGCHMWLFRRHLLFKLLVEMWTSCVGLCILARASHLPWSSKRGMFWNLGSLSTICMSLVGLYTPKPPMFPLPLLCSGIKEPSVYKLFDGLYLSDFGVKLLCGMDGVLGGVWVIYVVLGAFVHFSNVSHFIWLYGDCGVVCGECRLCTHTVVARDGCGWL